MRCTWDYFEAGHAYHGKGPCDSIEGTVKRSADLTVKQIGKVFETPMILIVGGGSSLAITF